MIESYVTFTEGSFIEFTVTYDDEDISDDSFAIYEANPSSIADDVVLTKTDPANGQLTFYLAAEDAAALKRGNANWFRLERTFLDGRPKTTEEIGIEII